MAAHHRRIDARGNRHGAPPRTFALAPTPPYQARMAATRWAIEVHELSAGYGRDIVLDGVELCVPPGEFLALIGPNGGGKTTLLRVLLGLLRPKQGTVRVLGAAPDGVRGRVGYVPQHARFDTGFPISVIDVVRMGVPPPLRRDPNAARAAALQALQQLEMNDLAAEPIGELSGGQLQRVLIARAVVMQPELLILDEPTASLDVRSADSFYELLHELARRMTVVLSSHDVLGVSSRADSIACLNRKLYHHPAGEVDAGTLAQVYGCPIELVAHGVPHRVLQEHDATHTHPPHGAGT